MEREGEVADRWLLVRSQNRWLKSWLEHHQCQDVMHNSASDDVKEGMMKKKKKESWKRREGELLEEGLLTRGGHANIQ